MADAALLEKEVPKVRVKRRGNTLGFLFFEMLFRTVGLKGAYLFLEIVCLHYLLFDREAVCAASAYTKKRFPEANALQNLGHVHRLFVNQGRQLIDRHAVARRPDFFRYQEVSAGGALEILQESSQGVVLLMSHAGNWQVALRQMGHLKKEICLVMRPEDNAAVRDSLQWGVEAKPVRKINPEGPLGGAVEIMQALGDGQVVCLMGDRSYGFDTVEVSFLRHPAYFPYGAFWVAAAAGCPVLPMLTHKISDRDYVVDFPGVWHPAWIKGTDKKEQLKQWVGNYVSFLEAFVEKHPYECFLFHDVWNQNKGVLNERK